MTYDDEVYEPAEDTFLFVDALEDDLSQFKELKPAICVEIGSAPFTFPASMRVCGTGAVCVYLATQLQKMGLRPMLFATDINILAATCAQKTARENGAQPFDIVRTDLLHCFEPRIQVWDTERGH
ncbi:hypothetical protein PsorP6_011181 [Peronosclerospora sorghi]|uniref:Uncharacterized protein n=1 Tax=Peronosclerospora sorghi TaxID=230839 RepID=A0ACC0VTW9_9STRA|nr:hypothetical protein PsorP6_011181 [Peronosclerospora sorghi]